MASTSETGHAKNIANFQDLISFCEGYGSTYNPTKEGLKIPQLQALHTPQNWERSFHLPPTLEKTIM